MSDINITADILDYIGKFQNGVLVLLTIRCGDDWSEGTLYYSDEILVLTVDESVEKTIGSNIELWPGYRELLENILKRVVPYDEIIESIDEIDFEEYFKKIDPNIKFGEDIDESEIKTKE